MTTKTHKSRPSLTPRRIGYAIAIVINVALLYLINVRPGWEAVPFLNADTLRVLGLVNLSLAIGAGTNLVYQFEDRPWVRSLGDLVSSGVALATTAWMLKVFPFSFEDLSVDWALTVRIVLIVATIGTAIAVVVNLVSLVRNVRSHST